MSDEVVGNPEALKKFAELLRELPPEEPKGLSVTDRHILCAMLGRPWFDPKAEAAPKIRKAG